MGTEKAEEYQRRFSAIAELMSGERYRELMAGVMPRFDFSSLMPPTSIAADIAAAVDAGQKATALLGSPSIVASIVGQHQDMQNRLAALGRTPFADIAKGLELRNSMVLDMPNLGAEIAASLDAGRNAMAILGSPGIIESIARQQNDLVRQLGSIGRLPVVEMLGAMDLRSSAIFETSRRLGALVQSDYFKGLMDSLHTLPQQILGLNSLTDSFFSYLRDLRPLEWLAAREFAERRWWLVPTWSTTVFMAFITERDARGCSMGTVLAEYYRKQKCRELGRTVRSWDLPEFSADRRASLFKSAVKDQRDRRFRSVIYALAPQVEGILKGFLINERLCVPADFNRTSTPKLFAKHVTVTRGPSTEGFTLQLQCMYSHVAWPDPAPGRRVRRHAQLHGREVPRNTEQEALRLWLMLDTLHYHLARIRRLRHKGAA